MTSTYTMFEVADDITPDQLREFSSHLATQGYAIIGAIDDVDMHTLIIVARKIT